MPIEVSMISHAAEIKEGMEKAAQVALTKCGLRAEGYAKLLCPVNTGNLRNSITNTVDGNTCEIGASAPYAAYVELGTGAGNVPGGSPSWVYTPDGGKTFYRTSGQPPRPFIKPAVADHVEEYHEIIEETLKNG